MLILGGYRMIERIRNNEAFRELERHEIELEQIVEMLWYVMEDYYEPRTQDLYTKANSFDRLYCFLYNIHTLLLNKQKDMQNYVENTYKLDKEERGGEIKCI